MGLLLHDVKFMLLPSVSFFLCIFILSSLFSVSQGQQKHKLVMWVFVSFSLTGHKPHIQQPWACPVHQQLRQAVKHEATRERARCVKNANKMHRNTSVRVVGFVRVDLSVSRPIRRGLTARASGIGLPLFPWRSLMTIGLSQVRFTSLVKVLHFVCFWRTKWTQCVGEGESLFLLLSYTLNKFAMF